MAVRPSRLTRFAPLLCGLVLLLLMSAGFWLRTHFVRDQVFVGDEVRFPVNDPWYHMRAVDSIVRNFPHQNTFDPFALFPGGQPVPVAPFFDWLLALIVLVVSRGSPTQREIDVICAYVPPILGCLTLLPVYFLGRLLFNRIAGLLAAALLIMTPGHFLSRTLLAYTDHHIGEVLFSTIVVLFLILALRHLRRADVTFGSLRSAAWTTHIHTLMLLWWAGCFLGMYLLTWVGGSLFVGIFALWLTTQFIVDHLRSRSTDYLVILTLPFLLIAALMVLPYGLPLHGFRFHYISLIATAIMTLVLIILSKVVSWRRWPRPTFLLLALLAGGLGVGAMAVISPDLLGMILAQFERFGSGHAKSYIPEAVPLLKGTDGWSLDRPWQHFRTAFFVAPPVLLVLGYLALRRKEPALWLLCIWSAGMFAATLGQNRFGYYLAVNVALLAGCFGAAVLHGLWSWFHARENPAPAPPRAKPGKRGKRAKREQRQAPPRMPAKPLAPGWKYGAVTVAGSALFFLLIYPNIPKAIERAKLGFPPKSYWIEAANWLRENTPEPFGDPEAYYALYEAPPRGQPYDYPATAYGITAPWGRGYWITRMAHRIPNANPGQKGAKQVGRFYTAQNEAEAAKVLDLIGARYVVIDETMPLWETARQTKGKFRQIARWTGRDMSEFVEICSQRTKSGEIVKGFVYRPAYYRSMLTRMYIFRGRPFQPSEVYVASFHDPPSGSTEEHRQLSLHGSFNSYAEARAYLDRQPPGTAEIVGLNAFQSCVPIEESLTQFRPVYRSRMFKGRVHGQAVPQLEIYEYLRFKGAGDAGDP